MFTLLWHYLPGSRPVKFLVMIALLVAIFFLLIDVVFPLVSPMMPYNDVAV